MQFQTFPMDEQECTLNIVSCKYFSFSVFLTLSREDKHSCYFVHKLSLSLIGPSKERPVTNSRTFS